MRESKREASWARWAGREKKGGRGKKRVWAGLEKKEGERDVCFFNTSKRYIFFNKAKRSF